MGCGASTVDRSAYTDTDNLLLSAAKDEDKDLNDTDVNYGQSNSEKEFKKFVVQSTKNVTSHPSSRQAELNKNLTGYFKHDPNNVEATWHAVFDTLDVPKGQKNPNSDLVVKRRGWKTVRIFVSSTFKDFQHERTVLVKEVFPDLRAWCEKRHLHLVECDLRWGVPKDSTTELTLRTCLGEIDRCYEDNVMPYFLNMSSERIGWIPVPGEVPQSLVEEYRWIFGLSVTEMEIIHGAYRKDNPNSLFMVRDESFLETVPAEHKKVFLDKNPIAPAKVKILRTMIEDRFPVDRVVKYGCTFVDRDSTTKKVVLDLDKNFRSKVFEFFRSRIDHQYPLIEDAQDPYEHMFESHEAFMKQRCDHVLGQKHILSDMTTYINGTGNDVPLLVVGGAGCGKSSLIAKIADETVTRAKQKKIPGCKGQYHVFYHFTGAVPGSTGLEFTLKRLLRELSVISDESMPKDLEETAPMCRSALTNPNCRPVIIIIDAINQFEEDKITTGMSWLPKKLAPRVRVVLSMIEDTPHYRKLVTRDPENVPQILRVTPLDVQSRKEIVSDALGRYNKRLDDVQMDLLVTKSSSSNPLWLSLACEELRVFGNFELVTDKIKSLRDGLNQMIVDVLGRFEIENGGHLLVATLCLLEASSSGLLENELLTMLSSEERLLPPPVCSEKGSLDRPEKSLLDNEKLPAYKWAVVYRALRTFLRPYGDSGEGRLDFYHRSLSKAVRRKYFKVSESGEMTGESGRLYTWWHNVLADFFEKSEQVERKIEEYTQSLIFLKDTKRLVTFLCQEEVIRTLYREDFSNQLLAFWREFGTESSVICCRGVTCPPLHVRFASERRVFRLDLMLARAGYCDTQGAGGREQLTAEYTTLCHNLVNSQCDDQEVVSTYLARIATILFQGGSYRNARDIAMKAIDIEEKRLGNRTERMAELSTVMYRILDGEMKLIEYLDQSDLPKIQEVLDWTERAIQLRRQLRGKHHEMKLAKAMVQMAFTLNEFAENTGNEQSTIEKCHKYINDAIGIFEKYNDLGNITEAIMTKAISYPRRSAEQLKYYEDAMVMCQRVYGDQSVLSGRLHLNMGIYFEEVGNYQKAFDYFTKNFQICCELYGPEHPRTGRPRSILNEATYENIAISRSLPIPSLMNEG